MADYRCPTVTGHRGAPPGALPGTPPRPIYCPGNTQNGTLVADPRRPGVFLCYECGHTASVTGVAGPRPILVRPTRPRPGAGARVREGQEAVTRRYSRMIAQAQREGRSAAFIQRLRDRERRELLTQQPRRQPVSGFRSQGGGFQAIIIPFIYFLVGGMLSAFLGSYLFFFAFMFWALNSIIRNPRDVILERAEAIRTRYARLVEHAERDGRDDASIRRLIARERDELRIESLMAGIRNSGDADTIEEMRRRGQKTLKGVLNLAAFAAISVALATSSVPMAGLVAIIVSLIAYFILGR